MVDVSACYNQQVSQVNAWSTNASTNSIYNVMRGACRNVALTCAYAVFAKDSTSCPDSNPDKCIQSISEMFYQSMLCPDNSTFVADGIPLDSNGAIVSGHTLTNGQLTKSGQTAWANKQCKCNTDFYVWNGKCMPKCGDDYDIGSSGTCVIKTSN